MKLCVAQISAGQSLYLPYILITLLCVCETSITHLTLNYYIYTPALAFGSHLLLQNELLWNAVNSKEHQSTG